MILTRFSDHFAGFECLSGPLSFYVDSRPVGTQFFEDSLLYILVFITPCRVAHGCRWYNNDPYWLEQQKHSVRMHVGNLLSWATGRATFLVRLARLVLAGVLRQTSRDIHAKHLSKRFLDLQPVYLDFLLYPGRCRRFPG